MSACALEMWSVLVEASDLLVLTIDQGKLRAGLDWPAADPRDELMAEFIDTATAKVERDTGLALLTQTRDVFVEGALPAEVTLPAYSRPLQAVASITYVDTAGATQTVDPATYTIDQARGLVRLVAGAAWPSSNAPDHPWVFRITAGYASADAIPPLLYQAVAVLTAHLATFGRDLVGTEAAGENPYGYDDMIATYRPVLA